MHQPASSAYHQIVPYNMSNIINIDAHKVEANDSIITGSNNVIFGNNNKIVGDKNKIYGNNNVVSGNDNVIKGDQNSVEGTGNQVSTPFGSAPFAPVQVNTSAPVSIPTPSQPMESPRKGMPMNAYRATSPTNYPMSTSPVNFPVSTSPMGFPVSTSPVPVGYPVATSPVNYPMSTSPMPSMLSTSPTYFQPIHQVAASQAIIPVMPQASYGVTYVNPFVAQPVESSNPFEAYKESKREKEKDLIQDGTMVFMINEWESDYIREFCQLVSITCGQQVGWHNSCGRTCIVGLGDLDKIREAIIELLPQLNNRLKEWSWNSFGKRVCADRDLYEKRLFKAYTREDVEIWRNRANKSDPFKAAA